nr:hypothetical protein [uncultured Oscillibacter sp.]
MSQDRSELLQIRLDQNYRDYLAQLREKPFDEIIKLAPEITAAQQLCGELLNACDDDDMEFLLRFDDPLEVVRGYWESEITGYSHKGEMGHMLWEIQDRELYEKEQLAQPSEKALSSPITPDNPAKPKIPLAYPGEDVCFYPLGIFISQTARFQIGKPLRKGPRKFYHQGGFTA